MHSKAAGSPDRSFDTLQNGKEASKMVVETPDQPKKYSKRLPKGFQFEI